MGLVKDIKKQWTWEGIKASFKKSWPDLLAVFLAGANTNIVLKYNGWQDSTLTFLLVFTLIYLLASIVIGLIMGIIRKDKE